MNQEKKKILVVDDNSANLTLINGILSGLYKVFPVSSAETALRFLQKQIPDLMLFDMEMPVMGGRELFEQVKKDTRLTDIPVIFLTGLSDMQSEADAFKLGAADYMQKPVNDIIMLHRVKTQIELQDLRNRVKQL